MILNVSTITMYDELLCWNTQFLKQVSDCFCASVRQYLVATLATFFTRVTIDIDALSRIRLENLSYLLQNIGRLKLRVLIVIDVEPNDGSLKCLLEADDSVHRSTDDGINVLRHKVGSVNEHKTIRAGDGFWCFLRRTEMESDFDTCSPWPYGIGVS